MSEARLGALKRISDDCFEIIDICAKATIQHQGFGHWHFQQLVERFRKVEEGIRKVKEDFDAEITQAKANVPSSTSTQGAEEGVQFPVSASGGDAETVVDGEQERKDDWGV